MDSFEHRRAPLLPKPEFYARVLRNGAVAFVMLLTALVLGVVGYHLTCGLAWIDSLLNASMILGGMGPVDPITTNSGKLFASAYALLSGVVFLTSVGVFLAPVVHRFLHKFHLESEDAQV